MGALTVTMLLWPPVVTLHLLGGNMLFGILVYLARVNFLENVEYSSDSYNINTKAGIESRLKRRNIVWMLAVLFIVIASGGYNSTTSSGAHCEAFPGCHEGSPFSFGMSGTDISEWTGIEENILLPAPQDFQGRFFPEYKNEWIHMIHRLIAVLGGIVLIIMAWAWLKNRYGHSSIGFGIVGLILLEFCVGILNAVYRVPAPISATHTAIAATLTGLMFLAAAERNKILVKE